MLLTGKVLLFVLQIPDVATLFAVSTNTACSTCRLTVVPPWCYLKTLDSCTCCLNSLHNFYSPPALVLPIKHVICIITGDGTAYTRTQPSRLRSRTRSTAAKFSSRSFSTKIFQALMSCSWGVPLSSDRLLIENVLFDRVQAEPLTAQALSKEADYHSGSCGSPSRGTRVQLRAGARKSATLNSPQVCVQGAAHLIVFACVWMTGQRLETCVVVFVCCRFSQNKHCI